MPDPVITDPPEVVEPPEPAAETPPIVEETPEAKTAKLEKRFSDVTREREAAKRRAEEAEGVARLALEALQRSAPTPPAPVKKAEDEKPVPPKFADVNDPDKFAEAMGVYTEKLTEWTARKAVQSHVTERETTSAKEREHAEEQRLNAEYAKHREKALSELPDFTEIAENRDLPVTPMMAAALKATGEMAPKLLYHLGQHPAEAERISKLSAGQQFMEIGELKAQLKSESKPKTLPPPIKPQGGGRSTVKLIEEMDMEEYAAHRQTQIKASKGR